MSRLCNKRMKCTQVGWFVGVVVVLLKEVRRSNERRSCNGKKKEKGTSFFVS